MLMLTSRVVSRIEGSMLGPKDATRKKVVDTILDREYHPERFVPKPLS